MIRRSIFSSIMARATGLHVEKLAILSADNETDEIEIRKYIAEKWWTLTKELKNAIILFIGGAHGEEDGTLGASTGRRFNTLEVQFSKCLEKKNHDIFKDKVEKFIEFFKRY